MRRRRKPPRRPRHSVAYARNAACPCSWRPFGRAPPAAPGHYARSPLRLPTSTRCGIVAEKRRREARVRVALQSLRLRCSPSSVTAGRRPLGIRCPFRVPGPTKYRSYWFCAPTLPLAVSSAAWFSFAGLRRPQLSDRCALSSGLAFLQSLAQRNLVRRPQPADSSHGLSFPSALAGSAVHLTRAGQPATFRRQGLATLWAAYSRRAPAGFLSRRRRSWDSPFGASSSRKVSAAFPRGRTHLPFLPSVIPPPKRWAGPTGRGFWVSALPGVPGDRTGISSPTAGCSLGFRPPRGFRRVPGPGFRRAPPARLAFVWPRGPTGRRLGVSIDTRRARSHRPANRTAGPSHPYRVFAPVRARAFERNGVRAMCSPCTPSCIAADPPSALRTQPRSTGVVRASPEVPNIRDLNVAR